jgi:hypothetical protein
LTQPLNAMIIRPRISEDDSEWLIEISNAELAIDRLLLAKRATVQENPQRETVLWTRYHQRLTAMKRKLDAVVM